MKRNSAIELLRLMLMFGICMCHSVGAGGYAFEPLRNICMMCTVGFIFITGWFGVRLSLMRVAKLLGIALFAWIVVAGEELLLHGSIKVGPIHRMMEWWFLRSYLMMMVISPILNSIVASITSSDLNVRRDAFMATAFLAVALYGLTWPMVCGWLPQIRVFMTIGCPCQPGTMCVIYLLARVLKVTGGFDRLNWGWPTAGLALSVGLAACSIRFSYYNSPLSFIFAASVFYFFNKLKMSDSRLSKMVLLAAPSCFFIYLYHSHYDPGFAILAKLQGWMVDHGIWIPLAWFATAFIIFCVGLLLDAVRRMSIYRLSSLISHHSSPQ